MAGTKEGSGLARREKGHVKIGNGGYCGEVENGGWEMGVLWGTVTADRDGGDLGHLAKDLSCLNR